MATREGSLPLSSSPLLLLAVSFGVGIVAADWFPQGFWEWLAYSLAAAVVAVYFSNRAAATLFVVAAFVFAGAFAYQAERSSIGEDRIRTIYDKGQIASGDPVEIEGVVLGGLESAPNGYSMVLETNALIQRGHVRDVSGKVRIFVSVAAADASDDFGRLAISPGDRLKIFCRLDRDDGFRNPGVIARTKILEWQGIDATASVKSPLLIEKVGESKGPRLLSSVYKIREDLIQRFRGLFRPEVAGVMSASLLGNDNYLDKQTADAFREGGTFHLLVISGMHITFIGGLAVFSISIFIKRRWLQFAIVCPILWLYTIAVGAESPALRACLMFTVLFFSLVIHRAGSLANAFGLCGLILLAFRPSDLFTPSFQLTFVCVGAIVLVGFPFISNLRQIGTWTPSQRDPFPARVPRWLSRLAETLYWDEQKWRFEASRNVWKAGLFKKPIRSLTARRPIQAAIAYLFEGVLISTIVQIVMLPLTVHYFHRVTPIGILLNLWTGLFMAVGSVISLMAIAAGSITASLAAPLVAVTEFVHQLIMSFPAQRDDLGWLSFRVPVYEHFEGWLYLAYVAALGFICAAVFTWDPFDRSRNAFGKTFRLRTLAAAGAGAICLGAVIVLHPWSENRSDGRLHVEFLDVGQGDSAFITFPNGETMLVDGGGRVSFQGEDDEVFEPDIPSIGETVVSEFLWERGYSQIGHLVASHADADHMQGLVDVARNFKIGRSWFGLLSEDDEEVEKLATLLERHEVTIMTAVRPQRLEIGGVVIEILHPPLIGVEQCKENDRSLVMRITYGSRTFLLTGDIEELAERQIVGLDADLHADVVKVPHHGSRTSSSRAFVDRTRPQFAVIPVGRNSRFGHPHQEVVERWLNAGAKIVTTGDRGTISFSTNGTDLDVSFFVPE
ncbi:MAG TPA: ComEC/Rec2 family competence protein [Pyrinomonadaceae bacterium]|nr:ComEC/Rec2 family competence protein [Pyrinomonadaceae bacterium]